MTIRTFKNITPTIGKNTMVDDMALVLGDAVLGDECSVWPMAVIRGDVHKIRIGNRTNVQITLCYMSLMIANMCRVEHR